jgi:hypothetical protein
VAVAAGRPDRLPQVLQVLGDPTRVGRVRGGLAVIDGDNVGSFAPYQTYSVGRLPWLTWVRWKLSNRMPEAVAALIASIVLLAMLAYNYLQRLAAARIRGTR